MAINFKDFGNKLRNADIKLRAVVAENQIQPTVSREKFFSSDDYQIGTNVLVGDTLHEIIDKRSNYVVVINESGEHSKQFPQNLEQTQMRLNYKRDTFKGVPVPEGLSIALEHSQITDPFGAIKLFEQFKLKQYNAVLKQAEKIGFNLDYIAEAIAADQKEALDIVQNLLKIKLVQTNTKDRYLELKRKVEDKHGAGDNQSIYKEMMGMLHMLGFTELYGDRDKDKYTDGAPHQSEVGHSLNSDNMSRKMRVRKLMSI